MKSMIKALALLFAAIMMISLVGCRDGSQEAAAPTQDPSQGSAFEPTEAPTPEPTEEPAPEPTEEPTPEPTPMPTEVPAEAKPLPEGDYFAPFLAEQPFIADIDGDGEVDIGLVTFVDELEHYRLYLTLSSDPENTFTIDADYGGPALCALVDSDPSDPQKEIVFAVEQAIGSCTYAVRMKDDGSGPESFFTYWGFFDQMTMMRGFEEDYVFHASEGFPMEAGCELLGTTFPEVKVRITANGFEPVKKEFRWGAYGHDFHLLLKRDLKLTTDDGRAVTAKKGSTVVALCTDMETYVRFRLEDGAEGTAELTVKPHGEYLDYYLNGVDQEEYADLFFA